MKLLLIGLSLFLSTTSSAAVNICNIDGVSMESIYYVSDHYKNNIESAIKHLNSLVQYQEVKACKTETQNPIIVALLKSGEAAIFEGFFKRISLEPNEIVLLDGRSIREVVWSNSITKTAILTAGNAVAKVDHSRIAKLLSTRCHSNGVCMGKDAILTASSRVKVLQIFEDGRAIIVNTCAITDNTANVSVYDLVIQED